MQFLQLDYIDFDVFNTSNLIEEISEDNLFYKVKFNFYNN